MHAFENAVLTPSPTVESSSDGEEIVVLNTVCGAPFTT
jgi:hypothetical protein